VANGVAISARVRSAGLALAIAATVPAATAGGWDAIDRHALGAPAAVEISIADLAAYLIAPARSDTAQARAIFRWITDRIVYDADVLHGATPVYEDPVSVLQSRRSICRGYAGLFQDLADAAGLEAVTVSGYGKAYGYAAGDTFAGPARHVWNAVRLAGRWQLLEPPWTLERFERQVYLRSAFFRCGLHDPSRSEATLTAAGELRLTLGAPPGIAVSARLVRDRRPLDETLVLTQRTAAGFEEIRVLLPADGTYFLDLYAGRAGESRYEWAMQYRVSATAGRDPAARFPETYGTFHERGATLEAPLTGSLRAGTRAAFRLSVPDAKEVGAVQGTAWTAFTRRGENFEGTLRVSPGELLIAAGFAGGTDYDVLLRYRGE
jgi:transglutaminase-like putative cysteine protease